MNICLFGDAQSVHIQRLSSGLAGRGHSVHIVSHKPGQVPGVTVDRFRVPSVSLTAMRRWRGRWMKYLCGFMQRFDVVNVHFLADWGFTPEVMEYGCLIATAWGSDIVPPPGEEPPSSALAQSRVELIRHAAAVTACGPTFARTVAEYGGIPNQRVKVVPFGVDVDQFKLREPGTGGRGDLLHVGFYKGFREVYGPTYLMRAIPLVLRKFPRTRFELVGDGPQWDECRQMAEVSCVNAAVQWTPRQAHDDLPPIIGKWDLSVIPSVCEAFGVAALESSAMGVPVVASNVGGLCDTVKHAETGWLVPPKSPEALADAVVSLLEDDDTRRRMGREGRAFVTENFNMSRVLDEWEALYARVREQKVSMV